MSTTVRIRGHSTRRTSTITLPANPFEHRLRLSLVDKLQVFVMSLTVAPVRVLFCAVSLGLAWVFATIALCARNEEDEKEPLRGWRKFIGVPFEWLMGRSFFFSMGFFVKVKGEPASSDRGVIAVVAPHSSYVDILPFFVKPGIIYCPVSRMENRNLIVIGKLTRYCQPIYVRREDPNSRQNTIKEIGRRAASHGEWPPIILFPEGTCTNRSSIISFKPGAFIPGAPVQPMCVKYYNRMNTVTWTWDGPGVFTIFWMTLCQFYSTLEVEFLPVYEPSPEEKADPKLYASNVRKVMAEHLDLPMTDYSFEDVRLMKFIAQTHMPVAEVLIRFFKLHQRMSFGFDQLTSKLDEFCHKAQEKKVQITLDEFAEYLDKPASMALESLFDLFVWDDAETIDFREYVIGVFLLTVPAKFEDIVKYGFKVFDEGDKGYLSVTEVKDLLLVAFGERGETATEVAKKFERFHVIEVTYAKFCKYAEQIPELHHLSECAKAINADALNSQKMNGEVLSDVKKLD